MFTIEAKEGMIPLIKERKGIKNATVEEISEDFYRITKGAFKQNMSKDKFDKHVRPFVNIGGSAKGGEKKQNLRDLTYDALKKIAEKAGMKVQGKPKEHIIKELETDK